MDPFKLLSSSTRIRALDGRDTEASIGQSRKRKRPSSGTDNSLSQGAAPSTNQQSGPKEKFAKSPKRQNQSASESTDLDARGKILKSHKIKISQLWEPPVNTSDPHVKSSRVNQTESKSRSKRKTSLMPEPLEHFSQLKTRYAVSEALIRNLLEQGFTTPTEVQLASLPLLLNDHRTDRQRSIDRGAESDPDKLSTPACHLLSVAPTGSGKTLSFLIPMMQSIILTRRSLKSTENVEYDCPVSRGPSALVLAPTKELAKQIINEARRLSHMTGVRATLVTKGMDVSDEAGQTTANRRSAVTKADILVSTPQALLNAAKDEENAIASFPSVSMLALDEADVLLDPLFREQTMSVWRWCTHPGLQVSLWSATMGSNIEDITKSTVSARMPRSCLSLIRLVVGLKDSSIPNIEHRLVYAASEQGKLTALRQLLRTTNSSNVALPKVHPPFLVFTQTIPRAIALHAELLYDIPQEAGGSSRIAVLHADLSDTTRDNVMAEFRRGHIWILITTDLLARGVDFRGVNGVISYDLPNSSAAYVHRAGRTGRAGREGGVAITLYSKDDLPFVKNVANVIAASERKGSAKDMADRQWIMDSLPKPSKRDKQRLKQRGVESRRLGKVRGEGRLQNAKTQISTKSAYERRAEERRKGAVAGSMQRQAQHEEQTHSVEDFQGFDSD